MLTMALVLMICLFSGCGGRGDTGDPSAMPDSTAPQTEDVTGNEAQDYFFAVGNYEKDEEGWPTDYYEYNTPFCTTGEILTYWTVNYTPQYLPEDGLDGVDFCIEEQRQTGVDIEYYVIPSETRQENLTALLASDDLPDIMNQADLFYPGTEIDAIENEYFANIYDYRDYCPNYMYFIRSHMEEDSNLYDMCFIDDTHISKFLAVGDQPGLAVSTVAVRGDWLDELDMNVDDITLVDDYENLARLMKSEMGAEYPIGTLTDALDTGSFFTCYDTYTSLSTTYNVTYPSPRVEDGKVIFSYTDDNNAKAFIEKMAYWVSEKLVNPNWMSISTDPNAESYTNNGLTGITFMPATSIDFYVSNNVDPDCRWDVTKKVSLYDGQVHHLGVDKSYAAGWGRSQISARCENIPLAVTWCDWRYSREGSFLASYGVEGTTWEMGEKGKPVATEWAHSNPDGQMFAFLMLTYAANALAEHGLGISDAVYMYPGGEKVRDYYEYYFQFEYDGAYEWPKGISLSDEQSDAFSAYIDINTYITENILTFVSGSKPLSEWDSYVEGLYEIGLEEAQAVYQEAYDNYMAKKAAQSA